MTCKKIGWSSVGISLFFATQAFGIEPMNCQVVTILTSGFEGARAPFGLTCPVSGGSKQGFLPVGSESKVSELSIQYTPARSSSGAPLATLKVQVRPGIRLACFTADAEFQGAACASTRSLIQSAYPAYQGEPLMFAQMSLHLDPQATLMKSPSCRTDQTSCIVSGTPSGSAQGVSCRWMGWRNVFSCANCQGNRASPSHAPGICAGRVVCAESDGQRTERVVACDAGAYCSQDAADILSADSCVKHSFSVENDGKFPTVDAVAAPATLAPPAENVPKDCKGGGRSMDGACICAGEVRRTDISLVGFGCLRAANNLEGSGCSWTPLSRVRGQPLAQTHRRSKDQLADNSLVNCLGSGKAGSPTMTSVKSVAGMETSVEAENAARPSARASGEWAEAQFADGAGKPLMVDIPKEAMKDFERERRLQETPWKWSDVQKHRGNTESLDPRNASNAVAIQQAIQDMTAWTLGVPFLESGQYFGSGARSDLLRNSFIHGKSGERSLLPNIEFCRAVGSRCQATCRSSFEPLLGKRDRDGNYPTSDACRADCNQTIQSAGCSVSSP